MCLAEHGGKERFFIACTPVSPPLPWRDAVVGRGWASALESVVQGSIPSTMNKIMIKSNFE